MNVGKVVAMGPDVKGLNIDDQVIYRQYSSTRVEWLGIEYMLIKSEDLQAKVLDLTIERSWKKWQSKCCMEKKHEENYLRA